MSERRKNKRRYLLYYARVFDAATRQQIGNLVDITPRGVMLVSEETLPVGKTFRLRLEVSDDVADKPFLDFDAKSLWCEPDVEPHFHNTGFKILDLAPGDAKIIRRIIEIYGFRDNKPVR
jgi:hypothetical protein